MELPKVVARHGSQGPVVALRTPGSFCPTEEPGGVLPDGEESQLMECCPFVRFGIGDRGAGQCWKLAFQFGASQAVTPAQRPLLADELMQRQRHRAFVEVQLLPRARRDGKEW